MAEENGIKWYSRARYYYWKEQDFTGKTGFHGRAGFYGSEWDFTEENGIFRERTEFHGRERDFTRNHEILWKNI